MTIGRISSFVRPVRAARAEAARPDILDELLDPRNACQVLRDELRGVLATYSPEQIEKLRGAGYRIHYRCLPDTIGGIQNGYKKRIDLNPNWAPNERRRAALHEIAHALDFLKRQARLGPIQRLLSRVDKPFDSQTDPRLEHLYRGYLARTATPQTQPTEWQKWASEARTPIMATLAATGAALVTFPSAALVVAAAGAAWTVKTLGEEVFAPRETDRFHEARTFPPDAADHVFSEYAARAHKSYEYLAEGVAFYHNNAAERELLRQRDPGLFAYVEEWNRVG